MAAPRSDRQSEALLSIGELARRSGVPATALRYYDDLGLVRPAARESGGRRRYAASAVDEVGVIRFLGEVGFTLAEVASFLAVDEARSRQAIIDRKLAELVEQQQQLEVAREVLEHGRHCPADDPMNCSRFWAIIDGHRNGLSVDASHAQVHLNERPRSARDRT